MLFLHYNLTGTSPFESISISVMDKARVESQERSDWVLRKPYAPAFGFKNTHLLPQRGKKCSVSGFALLSRLERNHARSAFKRFFPPRSLRRDWVLILLGQSLRVFDALSLIYSTSCYHDFGDTSFPNLSPQRMLNIPRSYSELSAEKEKP